MPNAEDAKALYNKAGQSQVVFTEAEEKKAREAGFTESYTYQHYPLALYKDGDRSKNYVEVKNAEEERAARKDGFKMIDPKKDVEAIAMLGEDPEVTAPPVAPTKSKAKAKAK